MVTALEIRVLSVPAVNPAHYERNFIKQAVCELRFPTLYELEGPRPPAAFAKAMRKEYPFDEHLTGLRVSAGPGSVARSDAHVFRSKRQRWTVTLRAASVTLETTNYDSFEEFKARLALVIQAAQEVIDSDFYTRVGLRYINVLEFPAGSLSSWVNPALVAPLAAGIYGSVSEHSGRVIGHTRAGGYTMQHGLVMERQPESPAYSLDFDFFADDVPASDALQTAQALHDEEFQLFSWSVGPAARNHLLQPKT